jgi:hypothetical protein
LGAASTAFLSPPPEFIITSTTTTTTTPAPIRSIGSAFEPELELDERAFRRPALLPAPLAL